MSAQSDYLASVYQTALSLGIPAPQARLAAVQSALETGYGASAPNNELFGVKAGSNWGGATTGTLPTTEQVGGSIQPSTANFRAYSTPTAAVQDWWNTLQSTWPQAASAPDFDSAVSGLNAGQPGGYATDQAYNSKVQSINSNFGSGLDALGAINQAAPTPLDLPNSIAAGYANDGVTASPQSTGLVKLASGKMIAPGVYGDSVVSDDGNGNAVVTVTRNALAAGPGTLVGGIAGQMVNQAAQQAAPAIKQGLAGIGSDVSGAAGNVVSGAQGLIQSGLGALGNFFGGSGSQNPTGLGALPNSSSSYMGSNGMPYTGANPEMATPVQQTYQQANPAYAAWLAQYGNGTANQSGSPDDRQAAENHLTGTNIYPGDISGGSDPYGLAALPQVPVAPPKTIAVKAAAQPQQQQSHSQPAYVQGSAVDSQGYYFTPGGSGLLSNVNWSN